MCFAVGTVHARHLILIAVGGPGKEDKWTLLGLFLMHDDGTFRLLLTTNR